MKQIEAEFDAMWVVVGSCGGALVLIVVAIVLYKLGAFRRRKYVAVETRAEEI